MVLNEKLKTKVIQFYRNKLVNENCNNFMTIKKVT